MSKSIQQNRSDALPPSNNMGGKSPFTPVPSSVAFVDQVSFTGKCADIPGMWFTNLDFAALISSTLEHIFGFGVTADKGKAQNFYESTFSLGDRWGQLCVGGDIQKDTFLVQITGQGALASKAGWEKRLYEFLNSISSGTITRLDLAHDDHSGSSYSPQRCREDYIAGKFTSRGRRPHGEPRGNWDFPDGTGRTFYIGKRKNGKFLRVYEKGKQLGGNTTQLFPNWTRVELELHNEGRSVPFDALINPGPYLAGSYPALEWISEEQCRIATKQKILQVSFEKSVAMVKNQVGRYINAMLQVYGTSEEVVNRIIRSGIPERLIVPDHTESPPSIKPAHPISADYAFDLAFSY